MHQDDNPDTAPETPAHGPTQQGLSLLQSTHLMYALFALALCSVGVFGLAAVAAMILAWLKRDEMVSTVYARHADWIARTFWLGLLWLALSALATLVFVGWITGFFALVWMLYRIIKGWLALSCGQPPMAEF